MDKKTVYKVFLSDDFQDGESLEYAIVYSDGSFDITYYQNRRIWFIKKVPELAYLEPEQEAVESNRRRKESVEMYMDTRKTWNDLGSFFGWDDDGWRLVNDREPDAFRTLCAVTREHNEDAIPPYKNSEFSVVYFGDGEPWERDSGYNPDEEDTLIC